MTERLERDGQDRALLSRRIAARAGRARGDPSRDQPRRTARHADHDRPCLGARGDGADPMGAPARHEDLRRDLPAIYHADRRRPQRPQHGQSGAKYVCSPPPRDRASWDAIWRGLIARRVPDLLLRPLPVPVRRRGRQAAPEGAHLVPLGAERHSGRRSAAADPVLEGRRRRGASRSTSSSR